MSKAKQPNLDFFFALLEGDIEVWEKNTFLNPEKKKVLVHGRKRWDIDSEERVTLKELKAGFTRTLSR